jgi:hypothetical protein
MAAQFRCLQTDEAFALRMSKSATVDDAKREVAAFLVSRLGGREAILVFVRAV